MDRRKQGEHKTCLLVGAHGGIGEALQKLLAADSEVTRLITTHRLPMMEYSTHSGATQLCLDLENPGDVRNAVSRLTAELDTLDYLVCASGLLHDEELRPEKCLRELGSESMKRLFEINAAGPLALMAGLEALLKKAANPKVLFLSAQVGSIGDNEMGGWYSYRMSKAALNMGIRCSAIEASRWQNDAVVMAVHPGTTSTRLSAPYVRKRKQPVRDASETARLIYDLLQSCDKTHHGGFFTAEGIRLPW